MSYRSPFNNELCDNPRRIYSLSVWNNSLNRRSHLPVRYNSTLSDPIVMNNQDIQSERSSRNIIHLYRFITSETRYNIDELVSLTGASHYECIRILSECNGNIDEAINIIRMNNRDQLRLSTQGSSRNRIGGLELLHNLAMEVSHINNSLSEDSTYNLSEDSNNNLSEDSNNSLSEDSTYNLSEDSIKENLSETLEILREMSDKESKMTEGKYLELSNLLMKIHKNI